MSDARGDTGWLLEIARITPLSFAHINGAWDVVASSLRRQDVQDDEEVRQAFTSAVIYLGRNGIDLSYYFGVIRTFAKRELTRDEWVTVLGGTK